MLFRGGSSVTGAAFVTVVATALFCGLPAARGQDLRAIEENLTTIADSVIPFCVKVKVVRLKGTVVTQTSGGTAARLIHNEVSLSGILLDSDGHVATLGETLSGARRVSASIFDGKEEHIYKAEVIGVSTTSNVGLIRLESDLPFKTPVLADSDLLRPGSFVIGIGYPFDLGPGPSVSVGIVSALHRNFRDKIATHDNLLETSFLIRPGETGGPLVNSSGEIAGALLTTFNGNRTAGALPGSSRQYRGAGITLAIPMNTLALEVEKILDKRGGVASVSESEKTPWLGIVAEEPDELLRKQVKLEEGGVIIFQVYAGQAAAKAGIRRHDILVRWNGELIKDFGHFNKLIGEAGIGKGVELVVIRNGNKIEKEIVIGKN